MVAMGVHSLRSGLKQLTHNCSEGMMRNLSFFSLYRGGGEGLFYFSLSKTSEEGQVFSFSFSKGFSPHSFPLHLYCIIRVTLPLFCFLCVLLMYRTNYS